MRTPGCREKSVESFGYRTVGDELVGAAAGNDAGCACARNRLCPNLVRGFRLCEHSDSAAVVIEPQNLLKIVRYGRSRLFFRFDPAALWIVGSHSCAGRGLPTMTLLNAKYKT